MAERGVQLAEATVASDPQLVAVFDLAGSVERFVRAVDRIPGLEFLAELREEYVDPDEDFYYEEDGEISAEQVPQSLYMVMTNAQAVAELIRLFELWQKDASIGFARGLNSLKEVFSLLRAIRRWGPGDRVRETGLLEQWNEDVAVVGAQGTTRVEIELWYRQVQAVRVNAQAHVEALVTGAGGEVIASSDQTAIAYHAVLADIPMAQVERVMSDGPEAIELLKTDSIMLVSPSRPMSFHVGDAVLRPTLRFDRTLPTGLPRIAILDGVPLANHDTLAKRLIVDDPDERSDKYSASQQRHGTAMASLVVHGDLSETGRALRQPIYVHPILQPHEQFANQEVFPRDELVVDVVHRAFRRMFSGDGDSKPSAPSVRAVNLSIGDPSRVFVRRMSPLARLLDWVAHEYNLVIIVSGGNHDSIGPIIAAESLFHPAECRAAAARSLYERARHRRLLSPAEGINVVTVGALHEDAMEAQLPDTVLDVALRGAPATYSPVGFGFRRSVKPDVLLPGGRRVFLAPPGDTFGPVEIGAAETTGTGPGLCIAAPGVAGETTGIAFSCGTSNAAALATRAISSVLDELKKLRHEGEDFPFPDDQYHPVLAKTLLVHAAGWHDLSREVKELLGLSGPAARRTLTQILGYGPVRTERLATADRVRVVLIGADSIRRDERQSYRFPLPRTLSASTEWRRLTITLGWLSPVNTRSQKYRMARLCFTAPRAELGVSPREAEHNAVLKGTVQHQVLEGSAAVGFLEGSTLAIDVDCRVDAGTLSRPVRYALAASLEVSPSLQVDLHEQVRTQLRAARAQAAAVQVRGSTGRPER